MLQQYENSTVYFERKIPTQDTSRQTEEPKQTTRIAHDKSTIMNQFIQTKLRDEVDSYNMTSDDVNEITSVRDRTSGRYVTQRSLDKIQITG